MNTVTTTHVPPENFPGSVEPVALPARLQSIPQPIPGSALECTGNMDDGFAPLRATLEALPDILINICYRYIRKIMGLNTKPG